MHISILSTTLSTTLVLISSLFGNFFQEREAKQQKIAQEESLAFRLGYEKDRMITQKIRVLLSERVNPKVRKTDWKIHTTEGCVTLYGTVLNEEEREDIGRQVTALPYVKQVINALEVNKVVDSK